MIKTAFPNAEIIGNKYGPPKPGGFEMFIEGVGPKDKRDNLGRFYVFRKNRAAGLPPVRAALDNLYILMYSYGDSTELAKYQDIWRSTSLGKSRSSACILEPMQIPETKKRIFNKETGEEEFEPSEKMVCMNWAC